MSFQLADNERIEFRHGSRLKIKKNNEPEGDLIVTDVRVVWQPHNERDAQPVHTPWTNVEATKKVLHRTGLSLDQMDIIELNEAFAAQSLACTRALGLADDDERVNPNGGAIAIGHPLGMTGARILQTASMELEKQKKKYALVSMCVGVGQGYATIIERV